MGAEAISGDRGGHIWIDFESTGFDGQLAACLRGREASRTTARLFPRATRQSE